MTVTDSSTLGFDAKRLSRIDDHLKKYVDDGRLPGWQVRPACSTSATWSSSTPSAR